MKNKPVNGTIKSQWGVTFPVAISYSGTVGVYQSHEEIVTANDLPNNDEIVRARNAQRVAQKRQKLVSDALDVAAKAFAEANPEGTVNPYIQPTTENSPRLRWINIYESVLAHSKDASKAAQIATAALDGYTPEDYESDAE